MIIELTNMCMVYQDDKILVLNRKRNNWPGLTFPGGHIEPNETILESVIREVKEETGLEVSNLEFVDFIEWKQDNKREIAFLYKTKTFTGELSSSWEGEVYWLPIKALDPQSFSQDFDLILKKYGIY